jgi:hypothetical protein
VYSLGPQTVSVKLPAGVKVKSVQLLRTEKSVPFSTQDEVLRFIIPSIPDYEVAAIQVS